MTTRGKSTTLPSYKYLLPSNTAGVGYLVSAAGDYSAKDTWALVPGGIGPYNATPTTPLPPQDASIRGQNATSTYAAPGGNVVISPGVGSVSNVSGNVKIQDTAGNSGWNTTHIVLGIYHLWIDSTGKLRIKSSAPASDTDGTVVGAQT